MDMFEACNNWTDLSTALDGRSETLRLEFKSELRSSLVKKSVCAFANTMGGNLIIGAEEADTRFSQLVGVPQATGIEEQIVQSCTKGIWPPVLPRVRLLADTTGQRVVAIVGVSASDQAPHAVSDRSRIYVRHGPVADPIQLANIEEIEHLLQRRSRMERLGGQFLDRATGAWERISAPGNDTVRIDCCVYPLYPFQDLMTLDELLVLARKAPPPNYRSEGRGIDGGVMTGWVPGPIRILYPMGLALSGRSFEANGCFDFSKSFRICAEAAGLSSAIFRRAGWFGVVGVRLRVSGVQDHPLHWPDVDVEFQKACISDPLEFSTRVTVDPDGEWIVAAMMECLRGGLWAYDLTGPSYQTPLRRELVAAAREYCGLYLPE